VLGRSGCLHEDAVDARDGFGGVDIRALRPDDQTDVARVDVEREGWRGPLRRRCTPSGRKNNYLTVTPQAFTRESL